GGEPMDALSYKHRYHDRLMEAIRYRIEGLRSGRYQARDWRVRGAVGFLEKLQLKGIPLYLGSGTDQEFVLEEAKLLDVDRFFPERIFGALDEYTKFSKEMLITQIISQLKLRGTEFMAFGDGYVEIRDTKRVGGVAIGVASREDGGIGWDTWKRRRLISAGADILIPDFGDAFPLLGCLQRTEPISAENLPS
ncbi:MAG TPA: HAD family hydrolase, partial [Acidobacteriota bacterium]|nr:HAD family hydrolase [Acidobacteriota bacterium]